MLQHIKKLLVNRNLLTCVWWGYFAIILYGSISPSPKLPKQVELLSDKGIHFLMYFFFHLLLYLFFETRKKKVPHSMQYSFIIAVLVGGTLELVQYYFVPNRFGEWLDFVANSIGSLLSVIFILIIQYILKNKEQK
jgi:VanZ family protein